MLIFIYNQSVLLVMELFRSEKQKKSISKTMSYILRHKPEDFGLGLDPEGFVELSDLVNALQQRFSFITYKHVLAIVDSDEKQRYKLSDNMICANYGHSLESLTLKYHETAPPEILFHGTAARTYEKFIKTQGIKKMNRLYVHLSDDEKTALDVGKRHGQPYVIKIKAKQAWKDGVKFLVSENGTYLVDFVDPKYFS